MLILHKMSRMRRHFGFSRLSGVRSNGHMVKQLCEVWFGYHKLVSSIQRFSKNGASFSHNQMVPSKVEKSDP